MKFVDVYQCELNKTIPLEYVGKVKYSGVNNPLSFTNNNEYDIVRDRQGDLKVVDDTGEDYLYDLSEPYVKENGSVAGKFIILDDPQKVLCEYI